MTLLERPLIGYPVHSDAAKLSGGGWESTLPLSSLQARDTTDKARSTDATTANTQFDVDLTEALLSKAVALVAHNLSRAATVRFRASHTPDFGLIKPVAPDISAAPWTDGGSPTVTRVTGPDGKSSGYTINDDQAGSTEYRIRVLAIGGGDGTKEVGLWVKKGTATVSVLQIYDTTATASRMHATITWSGTDPGTPAMAQGTFVSKQEGRDDWWYLRFTSAAITVANTNRLYLFGATDTASSTGTTSYAFPAVGPRNLVLDTNIASGTGWSSSGTPTVSTTTGPFGQQNGYTVYDDDAGAGEYRQVTLNVAANGKVAVNVWVKKGSAPGTTVWWRDDTAAANRLTSTITWSGTDPGTPTATTGTFISKTQGANGWWLLRYLTDSVTASNTNRLRLYGADAALAANTGTTAWALPWVEEDTVAYEDRHAGQWKDAYQPFTPGPVNLLEDEQDLSAWTQENTPIVRAGYADPFGGNDAWLIEDDNGAGNESIRSGNVTFLSDGTKVVQVYAKAGTAAAFEFGISDDTLATWRHRVKATWSAAGVPSLSTVTGSGTLGTPENMGNGWWKLEATATSVVSTHRNRVYLYAAGSTVADTGTTHVFRPLTVDAASIATSELATSERGYTDSKVPQWMLDDGYTQDVFEIPASDVNAQFWRCEISDTANSDGYVEIGRLMVVGGWQLGQNFVVGAGLDVQTMTAREETDGGTYFFDERPQRRGLACSFDQLEEDEALVRMHDFRMLVGTSRQFLWITNPTATHHLHRLSYPAVMDRLSPLQYPEAYLRREQAVGVVEER